MDLNQLRLNVLTVAELYRHHLVIPVTAQAITTAPAVTGQGKFLGNNRKHILIAVNNNDTVHLPDQDLELLTGIISACKLSLEDVAIINLKNFPGSGYKELTAQFSSTIVLLFGIQPEDFALPMSFPYFQAQGFTGVTYLSSPSLAEIAADRAKKTQLWNALKKLFNIS